MTADNSSSAGAVAIIVAAGRGHRLGGDVPKQYRLLAGRPVLAWTLRGFLDCDRVTGIRVVIHPDDRALYEACIASLKQSMGGAGEKVCGKILPPVAGGARRQDSVFNGLRSLQERPPGFVLIHDAARPFVTPQQIAAWLAPLDEPGIDGSLPALEIVDTIKRVDADGRVGGTVERTGLWRAQTPQCFDYEAIWRAHQQAQGRALTDDVAVAEAAGLTVKIVPGGQDNCKITTEEDLQRAERMIAEKERTTPIPGAGSLTYRTGMGFDVHAFEPGDAVILCGVAVPHDRKLAGHSDADVALHAVTDAILGAIGEGDIGDHFPPTEERWRGAPSRLFAEHARDLVAKAGGWLVHVDLTLICERPKIKPYRDRLRAALAEILGLPVKSVSLKATTTEGLGFTGRREGIAAQAVATVATPERN